MTIPPESWLQIYRDIQFGSRPAYVVPHNFIGNFHVLPQLKYLGEFEANFLNCHHKVGFHGFPNQNSCYIRLRNLRTYNPSLNMASNLPKYIWKSTKINFRSPS